MFKSKKEIDKHVRTSLAKLRTNGERNLRGLTIARLYSKIGEYETALHYVSAYLTVKEDCSVAHRLQAQLYGLLKKPDKALASYKRSLQLNPKQPDLLIEVCKYLQASDVNVPAEQIKYWATVAEAENIQHESALNLKFKLFNSSTDSMSTVQVEELLKKEIVARPLDVSLRIRLLNHYLSQGGKMIHVAFKYAYTIEMKQIDVFGQSLLWYNTLAVVLTSYKLEPGIKKDWSYRLLLIRTLERQVYLSLCHTSDITSGGTTALTDCISVLCEFDQQLSSASKALMTQTTDRELITQFVLHYSGQLCLHAASLLFKREQLQKRNEWQEVIRLSLPLLLLAYTTRVPDPDEDWLKTSTEQTRQLIRLWHQQGAFRCAQAGRTLLSCVQNRNETTTIEHFGDTSQNGDRGWTSQDDLLAQIRKHCSDTNWRRSVYRHIFSGIAEWNIKQNGSFLINSNGLAEPQYEIPQISDLEQYEESAQWLEPSSLSHSVYLIMDTKFSEFSLNLFNGLNLSCWNLTNCGAETLNQLDVRSFLYATAIQARRYIENEQATIQSFSSNYMSPNQYIPYRLPYANCNHQLATDEQASWWSAAYRVYKNNSGDDLADLRSTLQFGIETVRGVGGPRMDVIIALKIGQVFAEKAGDALHISERTQYEYRAEALFKYSLHMIRLQSNRAVEPFRRYFRYGTIAANQQQDVERETDRLAEEAITFLATRHFRKDEYEECIDELDNIDLPFAAYFQAEAYRKMDESNKTPKRNKKIYKEKSAELLKRTVHLLEHPSVDRNHPLRSIIESDLKKMQQSLYRDPIGNNYQQNETSTSTQIENYLNTRYSAGHRLYDSPASNRSIRYTEPQVIIQEQSPRPIAPPPTPQPNLEPLIRELIATMSTVKIEVSEIKEKMKGIEEQLNRKQETDLDGNNQLDDYFVLDDETSTPNYGLGAGPYFNQPGNYNQQLRTNEKMLSSAAAVIANSFQGYPHPATSIYGGVPQAQYGMSPYQQAGGHPMINVAAAAAAQAHLQPYLQQYVSDPALMAHQLYGSPSNMNIPPPNVIPQPAVPNLPPVDSRNSIMGLLTHPNPQLNISGSNLQSGTNQNLIRSTWNSAYNNQPVEKGPPVNVVITSSDPLPILTTSTVAQPTLSVTIPPQHIKNNQPPVISSAGPSESNLDRTINSVATNTTQVTKSKSSGTIFGGMATSTSVFSGTQSVPAIVKSPTVTQSLNIGISKDVVATTASKPNPFASFTFGTTVSSTTVDSESKPTKPAFSNLFSDLVTVPKTDVSPTATKSPNVSVHHDEDDYVPTAKFDPVIPLPDLIEVKTGEEDEFIKFEHRAKLLRYDKETKQWKDRGIGNIKLLVNKMDSNKVRLLMRREQVLKLCCNQFLTKEMEFKKRTNMETAITWVNQDYSENELQIETFTIRFKEPQICKEFLEAIQAAQASMTDQTVGMVKVPGTSTNPEKTEGFGGKFKPKSGTWDCSVCYLNNKAIDKLCIACKSSKDNPPKPARSEPVVTSGISDGFGDQFKPKADSWHCFDCYLTNQGTDKFCPACNNPREKPSSTVIPTTKPNGFGDQFKPKAGSWSCKSCYLSNTGDSLYCVACEQPKDDTVPKKEPKGVFDLPAGPPKFTFGVNPTSQPIPESKSSLLTLGVKPIGSFTFGTFTANLKNTTSPSIFSAPETSTVNSTNEPVVSESPNLKLFEPKDSFTFVFKPKSPGNKVKSPTKCESTDAISDDENVEEEENNTYFTPVIPLPDKIDVKTGEEDEIVLYSHRAKLFRFADSEWKERGLGDVKILRHTKSGKLRVVMRRDQILKICLNHALTDDVEYKVKDEKSWHFVVNDFSEGAVELMQFCLRFKTADIAFNFKDAIDNSLAGKLGPMNGNDAAEQEKTPIKPPQNPPVQISLEDHKLAKKLLLPDNFFGYKQVPDCTGCRGCNSDSFIFPTTDVVNIDPAEINPLPLMWQPSGPPKPIASMPTENIFDLLKTGSVPKEPTEPFSTKVPTFSFGTNLFSQSLFTVPVGQESQGTIFSGQSNQLTVSEPEKKEAVSKSETQLTPATFSFGKAFESLSQTPKPVGSIFGDLSVKNGSDSNLVKPTSIFGGLTDPKPVTKSSIFGESKFLFGNQANGGSTDVKVIFGGDVPALIAPKPVHSETETIPITDENIFKGSGLSFADLAQQSTTAVSPPTKPIDPVTGFFGLSTRDDFSSFASPTLNNSNEPNNSNISGTDDNYDPHYDPIIALPNKIVVTTGEEDEIKVYGERAKLYRYDGTAREWKERGVGELKILYHPTNRSYRFLMRREQIFKCVLNHGLPVDFNMSPMSKSDKAFCWATQNFAEESVAVEQLSVRFKNADIARKFEQKVNECIESLKSGAGLKPEQD